MTRYLIVLTEEERSIILSALEMSPIYGSHAKSFIVLIDKVAGLRSAASPLEEEREVEVSPADKEKGATG